MRDALSILDQAIASSGDGRLTAEAVRQTGRGRAFGSVGRSNAGCGAGIERSGAAARGPAH